MAGTGTLRVDRALRQRLLAVRLSAIAYCMFLLPLGAAVALGMAPLGWAGFAALAATALSTAAGFHWAIARGWTRRFADPSLTLLQISVAAALVIVMARHAGAARDQLMMLSFSGLLFGMYTLSLRQMLALSAGTLLAYALAVLAPDWPRFSPEQRVLEVFKLFTLAAVLVSIALFAGRTGALRRRLRHLAMRDELTGTYNRRFLLELLAREQDRCERHGGGFAVVILDLDHFKRINDSHGHDCGDQVLRQFAATLRQQLRNSDALGRGAADGTVGRLGGEEFMVVLPHCDLAGARTCLERLRLAVAAAPLVTSDGPLPVTFSGGIAVYRQGERDLRALLRRADQALYRAKAAGRNRVEVEAPAVATA